jgi:AraC family transcriptional regulator
MLKLPDATYFGRQNPTRCVDGLTFTESRYEPRLSVPRHSHANPLVCLVVGGTCRERVGRDELSHERASVNYLPAGRDHSARWSERGGHCFFVEVLPERLARLSSYAGIRDNPVHFAGGAAPWLAGRLHAEFSLKGDASDLAMEGLALELIAEVCRGPGIPPEPRPPRWLLRARDQLKAEFATPLSLERLAAEAGVHPVHFARTFRRFFGRTPGEHVRVLRIEHACRLLETTDAPLADVALAAGFADQSHLSKAFRRSMRTTPGRYRRSVRMG